MGTLCLALQALHQLSHRSGSVGDLRILLPPSSGREKDICMMCIMEGHVNNMLCSEVSAVEPWAVVSVLPCKALEGL